MNSSPVAIDAVHLTNAPDVETGAAAFDRPATQVVADEGVGYGIYALEQPLPSGDWLEVRLGVNARPRGFRNDGVDASVAANGTYFTNEWLPTFGYRADREIPNAGIRSAHGLSPRPAVPSLYDAEANQMQSGAELVAFEAVVGTEEDQVAVAPGALRRTWTEGGRRYFHYSTDCQIRNHYAFFSADYAVQEGQWNDVAIQIMHHPGNTANLDRMLRSLGASLDYFTEQFGPYPHSEIRLIEHPGLGVGLTADAVNITYQEGFSLLNPRDGPRDFDLVFAVVAHEVAHQRWGLQLAPAVSRELCC